MEEIVTRITQILEDQQLSSSAFADTIGVQRSSISHVLSGRNKPSLEFILKTVRAFPAYSTDWLLFGKESETPVGYPSPIDKEQPTGVQEMAFTDSLRPSRAQQHPRQHPNHKLKLIRLFYCIKTGVLQSTSRKMINFAFKISYATVFPFCFGFHPLYRLLYDRAEL